MTSRKEPSAKQGLLMFLILLIAYIVFAANWVAGSNLSKQITSYFFNGEAVSPVLSETLNYTITIARIFANFLAAFVLIKLGVRKAAIVALVLLCFAFIAVFTPNYFAYTGARMIMALGGSMIMVYMNTVVAKFISADKRIITSALITAAYNIGALSIALPFFFFEDIVKSTDWQTIMMLISGAALVMLALWVIFGKDFDAKAVLGKDENHYTYGDALKDSLVYRFSLGFGGFLFLYVMSLVSLPNKIVAYVGNPEFDPAVMILSVSLGAMGGTIFSILIRNNKMLRIKFLTIHGILMISAMAIGLYTVSSNVVVAYAAFAFAGFVMFSQYSVYLNLPYEMPDMDPHKLTIMFGIFWAFGYTVYTILNFLWSGVLGKFGWDASVLFYLGFSCLYIIFVLTLPETRKKQA